MSKKIEFEHDSKKYTLEFTRRTIREMENEGFRIDELSNRPMTLLPELFIGAFKCHHPYLKRKDVLAMFEEMSDRRSLLEALTDMYQEPIQAIFDEQNDPKNVKWTVTEG